MSEKANTNTNTNISSKSTKDSELVKYYRKVIKIKAEDSPNVVLGLAERANNLPISNKIVLDGILPMAEYMRRRKVWDRVMQCISLDGEFYEGSEELLLPPEWLNLAEVADIELEISKIARCQSNKAKALGVDPAEGRDKTSFCVVDYFGIVELIARLTPDTTKVTSEIIHLIKKYSIDPKFVTIDRGGGGKEHADRLREQGYDVNTLAFGEPATPQLFKRQLTKYDNIEKMETKYTYKNKRAEIYGMVRDLLNPNNDRGIRFGISSKYVELRNQLSVLPLLFDQEGRIYMLPKNKRSTNSTEKTLVDLIGHSPDEADSFALAVYTMCKKPSTIKIGAII